MGKAEEIPIAARKARESQELIASPELRHDPDYRDYLRESIGDIQKVIADVRVHGKRSDELNEKLQAFGFAVENEIERLAKPGATDENDLLGVVPAHKEFLKEQIVEALRVHLIGFFRANQGDLSATIFDDAATNEHQRQARSHYIQEFIANFCTHLSLLGSGTVDTDIGVRGISRLATRKMPDFTTDFFYGTYIHETLEKAGLAISSEDEKTLFSDGMKRNLLGHYLANVDERIIATAANWTRLGDPAFISQYAGELPISVEKLFSPGIRRSICNHYSTDGVPTGIKLVADNYRLIADVPNLVKILEAKHGIRITSGADVIPKNFVNNRNMLLISDPPSVIAGWLREKGTLGHLDHLRSRIVFEDLKIVTRDQKD